jgi:hypothetical protein
MQAELFDRPEPDRSTLPPDQREWTREPVSIEGDEVYLIMVRAPGDPERRSREARHDAMGVAAAASEWKRIRKATVEQWAERFLALLSDGRAVTLNALTVELADITADVVGDNAIAALWLLKDRGLVEHTIDAPVLWRLTRGR